MFNGAADQGGGVTLLVVGLGDWSGGRVDVAPVAGRPSTGVGHGSGGQLAADGLRFTVGPWRVDQDQRLGAGLRGGWWAVRACRPVTAITAGLGASDSHPRLHAGREHRADQAGLTEHLAGGPVLAPAVPDLDQPDGFQLTHVAPGGPVRQPATFPGEGPLAGPHHLANVAGGGQDSGVQSEGASGELPGGQQLGGNLGRGGTPPSVTLPGRRGREGSARVRGRWDTGPRLAVDGAAVLQPAGFGGLGWGVI